MATLSKILSYAVKNGASDVHLTVGSPPAVRIDGKIRFIEAEALTPSDTREMAAEMLNEKELQAFLDTGDAD